jgi:hypothetical protein
MKNILIVIAFLIVLTIGSIESIKAGLMHNSLRLTRQLDSAIVLCDWGPRETSQRKRFNIQPNGVSAMWVKVKGVSSHPETHILFGGNKIKNQDLSVNNEVVTFSVRDDLISKSGSYEVIIINGGTKIKIPLGVFNVKID